MTEGNTAPHAEPGNQQEASNVPQIDTNPNAAPASPNLEAQRSMTSPQSPFMIVAPRMASTERTALLAAAAEEDHPATTGSRRSVAFASPSPLGSRQQRGKPERPRPRFWFLLPLLALIDLALEAFIGFVILNESPEDPPSDGRHGSTGLDETKKTSLVWTLLTLAFLRTSIMGIVGIGNKSDQLGLMVATMAALSILILLAVLNLLFQSGDLFSRTNHSDNSILARLPIRPLALMTAISGTATILEYLLYIAVVGIRVPPTQMREARRWKRGVRASQPGLGEEEWLIEEEEPQQRTASSSFRGRSVRRSPSSSDATEGVDAVVAAMPRYGATDQTEQSVTAIHFDEGGRLEAQHVSNEDAAGEHQQEQAPKGSPQVEQLIELAPSAMEEGAAAEDLSEDIEEGEEQDPNEIVDIGVPSSFSRDASRARLELSVADEAERARRRRDSRTSSAHLLTSPGEEEPPSLAQEEENEQVPTQQSASTSNTAASQELTNMQSGAEAPRYSIITSASSKMTPLAEEMSKIIIEDMQVDKDFYSYCGHVQKGKWLDIEGGQLRLNVITFKSNKVKITCNCLPKLPSLVAAENKKERVVKHEILKGLYDMENNRWVLEEKDQTPTKPLATLKAKGQGLLRSISGSVKNSSGGGEDDGSVSSKGKRRRLFSNNLGRKD